MAGGKNIVPRNSRVEPFQFRHPEPGLGYGAGRNFSERLEVIRVDLLENSDGACRPHEVNPSGRRVIVEVVCTADGIQNLDHFPSLRIHDNELARFTLVPAADITGVGHSPATYKQAVMGCVEAGGMGHRPSDDGPLRYHCALFEIDDGYMAAAVHNVSHGDVQSLS